jgi:hypothetical protein
MLNGFSFLIFDEFVHHGASLHEKLANILVSSIQKFIRPALIYDDRVQAVVREMNQLEHKNTHWFSGDQTQAMSDALKGIRSTPQHQH